jgi:hypothetical protein
VVRSAAPREEITVAEQHRTSVPDNAGLAGRAPRSAFDAFRGWLSRHPTPRDGDREAWLDFAAGNILADPQLRPHLSAAAAAEAAAWAGGAAGPGNELLWR